MKYITAKRDCERCNSKTSVRLVRNITQSGVSQVYWYCVFGEHSISKNGSWISHEVVRKAGFDPEGLPVINNYSGSELCEVCQSPFTELHHWAPRHLFDDEAHEWPTAYLCKKHHDQWHSIVTPEMGKVRL